MTDVDLHHVLARATDALDDPAVVERATGLARARLARRRAALVVGAVAATVAVIVVAPRLGSVDRTAPADNSPPPTAVGSLTPTSTPEEPASEEDVGQPRWDPRRVLDLPRAGEDVAPGLPDVVSPPPTATGLAGAPIDAAVLVLDRERELLLLATDGSWRSVAVGDRQAPAASLSAGGTRLLVPTTSGAELWDLPTARRTTLPFPDGYEPWDYVWWSWVDESTVLLDDLAGGWLVDTSTGSAERVPYPSVHRSTWTVDETGAVVEVTDPSEPAVLTDWAAGEPRRVDLASSGSLSRLSARQERVAAVSMTYGAGQFRVALVDRADGELLAALPLHDFEGNYSNWGLSTVAVLEDGSVLLWVAVPGRDDEDGWAFVAWDPESGDIRLVTTSAASPTQFPSVAEGLLGAPGP